VAAARVRAPPSKAKPGQEAPKGGVFAVTADSSGKLNVTPMMWNGPDAGKQCIVDAGSKATITPMAGPPVSTMWEFTPPGEQSEAQKPPAEFAVHMQPLQETMQNEVINCGQRTLGVDFGATIEVSYFLYKDGKAYAPTVIMDDSKDGSFEQCVLDVIAHTSFPKEEVPKPFGTTSRFKIGQYGDTKH